MWNSIKQLYEQYGFKLDCENNQFAVFTYEQGYFNNAEIIIKDNPEFLTEGINRVRNEYETAGYAVKIKKDIRLDCLRKELFVGFFKVKQANQKVMADYHVFRDGQKKRLGGFEYNYINSKYTCNGEIHDGADVLGLICEILNRDRRQLVILEAPAGFGKTCTSYEIANLLAVKEDDRIPMLAELSKNRTASIFRYVLLSEIDEKFNLSYNLVYSHILEGNIPLIIDGFDELLSRADPEEKNDEAVSMLDTIAQLLEKNSNAKILLTSRKSSIFAGDTFDKWLEDNISGCNVTRIQILQPTIADWLDKDKRLFFQYHNIDITNICNPVLLTMLKNKPLIEYEEAFSDTSDILETYINLMFERERGRQLILLSSEEMREVMRRLAAVMVQLDISAANRDEIKTLIETAIEDSIERYLEAYRDYNYQESIGNINQDSFLSKLANNVMLDRIKANSNEIGFINDYIFGIFIGEAITHKHLVVRDAIPKYLDMAITSFSTEKESERENLFNEIVKSGIQLSTNQKISVCLNLTDELSFDFVDEYISNIVFEHQLDLNKNSKYFYNCIFDSCTFNDCILSNNLFEGCHFINCNFYHIKVEKRGAVSEESLFVSCMGHEALKEQLTFTLEDNQMAPNEIEKNTLYFKKKVLEQFWMPGSSMAGFRKSYRTVYKGTAPKDRKFIAKAIEELKAEGIMCERTYCYELNKAHMNRIAEIVGRNM